MEVPTLLVRISVLMKNQQVTHSGHLWLYSVVNESVAQTVSILVKTTKLDIDDDKKTI